MSCLNDIPSIAKSLKNGSTSSVKLLHRFIYGSDGDRQNRARLRKFSGFPPNFDLREAKQKVLQEFGLRDLIAICTLLHLEFFTNPEKCCDTIFTHLNDISLLNTELSDFSDDEEIAKGAKPEIATSGNEANLIVPDQMQQMRLEDNRQTFSPFDPGMSKTPFQAFSLKDIVDLIKPFSSKDNYCIETFISDLEDLFKLYEIQNPIQQITFVKKCLTGPALTLIRSIRGITTWEQMKAHLLDEFSDKINSRQLHQLMAARRMKQTETLQEYFLAMRDLAHKGSLENTSLFDYVINGIPDTSSNKIFLYGCKSISEFKEKLKIYENLFNPPRHLKQNTEDKFVSFHPSRFDRKRPPNSQPICYSCGIKGHKSTLCPNREKGKQCYGCKGYGHVHANCPKNPRNASRFDPKFATSDKTVTPVSCQSIPANPMHVQIVLADKIFSALCDTGSEVTIINETTYLSIGSPRLNHSQIIFSGIGRDKVKSLGYFQDSVKIQNLSIPVKIHVFENDRTPIDVIIGKDLLEQTRFTFDKDGIHFLGLNCNDDVDRVLIANINQICNVLEDQPSRFDFSHISNTDVRDEVQKLITSYKSNKIKDTEIQMSILLTDEIPVAQRSRRLPLLEQKIVENQIQDWLNDGIIKPSCSDYAAPIVLCKKKNGDHRLCIDYRKLNRKMIKDKFPLPLIEEVIDKLENSRVFTSLDLKNGFFHVPMDPKSTKYTSFVTHEGQYEFLRVPFGLSNSPSVFQRYIYSVFRNLIRSNTLIVYMDDLVIPSNDEIEGLQKLRLVLETAADYGLELNLKKCQFLQRKIEFLGYVIENGTIKPSPLKTRAVQNFPQPKTPKQVQSFLGLTSYFRKFIENYALIARPLSDLLRDNIEFKFGPEQISAFNRLKNILSEEPVLHVFRQGYPLELHTDASALGFGAILLQKSDDGQFHPIHYFSRKTTVQQEKYSSYELEVLAIIEALQKFRPYLLGTKFKIITDCDAFEKTMHKKDLPAKIARWALMLEDFDYEVCHRPGKQMKHADALSRYPVLVISSNDISQKVKNAQDQDEFISNIKSLIEKTPSDEYILQNRILYKLYKGLELLVVPQMMQKEIVLNAHSLGHFGVQKTESIVSREFYIPQLTKLVQEVVSNCIPCILSSKKSGKQEGLLHPIPKGDEPLNCYHCDFLGPLPSTKKCYKYLFTVIDAFSKFVWIYPVRSTSTRDALERLLLQQTTFGNPSRIITDKGSAFTSTEFETFCQEQSIEHITITTGVPRGNGQIERIHGTLIPVLAKLSIDDPTQWFKFVPRLQRILNSTTTRSTKFTPFEVLTGVKMKQKEDLQIKQLLDEEHILKVFEEREILRNEAKQNISRLQAENVKQYNKRRKPAHKYKLGDKVAIQRTQFGTGLKLRPRFFGPYEITKINPNDRYEVRKLGCHDGPTITSTAADKMKPWSAN